MKLHILNHLNVAALFFIMKGNDLHAMEHLRIQQIGDVAIFVISAVHEQSQNKLMEKHVFESQIQFIPAKINANELNNLLFN